MTKDEALKQAILWADFHGQDVFAGGGMNAVNSMNEWRAALAEALAQPAQRPWVGLTEEDVENLCLGVGTEPIEVRLIEAKLKEKNT